MKSVAGSSKILPVRTNVPFVSSTSTLKITEPRFCFTLISSTTTFISSTLPNIERVAFGGSALKLSTSGSLKGDTLTLNGVPNVIYFSDRPARKAGHMSLSEFVEMWNKGSDSFKADPPNATLSVLKKDGANNIVVELTSVDQKNGSVVFKVAVLEGKVPKPFKAALLFVDVLRAQIPN